MHLKLLCNNNHRSGRQLQVLKPKKHLRLDGLLCNRPMGPSNKLRRELGPQALSQLLVISRRGWNLRFGFVIMPSCCPCIVHLCFVHSLCPNFLSLLNVTLCWQRFVKWSTSLCMIYYVIGALCPSRPLFCCSLLFLSENKGSLVI